MLDMQKEAILDALAVAEDSLTRSSLTSTANRSKNRAGTKTQTTDSIEAFLETLHQEKRVVQDGVRWRSATKLAEERFRKIFKAGRYVEVLEEVRRLVPLDKYESWGGQVSYSSNRPGVLRRELRAALLLQDDDSVGRLIRSCSGDWQRWFEGEDADIFWDRLTDRGRELALQRMTTASFWYARPHGISQERLYTIPRSGVATLAREAWLRGDEAGFSVALESIDPKGKDRGLHGLRELDQGNFKKANTHFAAILAAGRKTYGSDFLPDTLESTFLVLSYLLDGTATRKKQALRLMALTLEEGRGYQEFPWNAWMQLTRLIEPKSKILRAVHPLAVWVQALVAWWEGASPDKTQMKEAIQLARELGWNRIVAELEGGPSGDGWVRFRKVQAPWMNALEKLEVVLGTASRTGKGGAGQGPRERLAWEVFISGERLEIEAKLQVRKGKGWSAGRRVALKRLSGDTSLPRTPEDMALISGLRVRHFRNYQGYSEVDYSWDPSVCWPAMARHPAIFDTGGEPLQIEMRPPELVVQTKGGKRTLRLEPECPPSGLCVVELDWGYEVTVFDSKQREIAAVLRDGLTVPAAGAERAAALVESMGSIFTSQSKEESMWMEGNPTPIVLLRPVGHRVVAELVVRPAGEEGGDHVPGSGSSVVIATVEGRVRRVRRDLSAEREGMDVLLGLEGLVDATPISEAQWRFESVEDTLAFLEAARREGVELRWPEGESLKLRPLSQPPDLSLAKSKQWLVASGTFTFDEEQSLSLAGLLKQLLKGAKRFIRLDDGSFFALEENLRKELDALARVSTPKGKSVRVHPLAMSGLRRWTSEEAFVMSAPVRASLERLNELPDAVPVPSDLGATLRAYQEDAYRWMVRMGTLEAGALLADDMGLGKTLTTLAVLLHRRALGPSLVVAPTSVAGGWMQEAMRFAPGLRMVRLRSSADRARTLAALQAGDVLVCSYGLLVSERESLSTIDFNTVVFDECQALKNAGTQRHKAALSLQARFRIGLTGTPIENHLGELHAQMEVLIPGLLGSKKSFTERFVRPIEAGEREVRHTLSSLLRVLLLRRTKGEVLQDLPARTDIQVPVELSAAEAILYEAQRQHALDALESEENTTAFSMLPHLMRLRQLACSPALVLPDYAGEGSKTTAFRYLVRDLVEGGHRALVFSQFVKHLDLLSKALEEEGLEHFVLQGATPAAERDRLVREFQSGDVPLFLISLRAGGTGLNLTAADYVIHMDPWWNPAVEDQASDRAHRIGQQRPVTVYRLVAKGTVEEQILDLHRTKRSLADDVLQGTDAAAKMTADQLLSLIKGDE